MLKPNKDYLTCKNRSLIYGRRKCICNNGVLKWICKVNCSDIPELQKEIPCKNCGIKKRLK